MSLSLRMVPTRCARVASRLTIRRMLSSLPDVPEPPLPSAPDAQLDRTGAISDMRDPFMSRKLQGKGGTFRGRDIVPMWIADMDFRCPQPVVDATIACAQRGIFGYTNCPPALQASTLERLGRVYGCSAPESEWLHWMPGLVPGLSHAVRVAKRRCPDAVARVAVLTPAYPPFLALPAYHGAALEAVPLASDEDSSGRLHFEVDWDALEASLARPETTLLLLCNPHNPTGRCWTPGDLGRVAELCVRHDVLLCSDEVWGEMPLEPRRAPFHSALSLLDGESSGSGGSGGGGSGGGGGGGALRERLIVITSPSKCFNVATLDVALAVVPDATLRSEFIAEGRDMAEVTPFGYFAAEAAYGDDECEAWRQRLVSYVRANRDYAMARLAAVPGVRTTTPESSYLLWVDGTAALERRGVGEGAAAHILAAGVGVSDGADFGAAPGFFRVNVACARSTLERGLSRIVGALE